MKKVLIISNSYPNNGGQSTTTYNLLKLLQKYDLDVRLIYVNYTKHADTDPDKTGASHKIALRQNFIYRAYHWYKRKYNVGADSPMYGIITRVKDMYFSSLLLPRLFTFLLSKRFSPDLVITNIPVYYSIIKRIFDPKKTLVIVGSSSEMYELSKHNIDAQTVMKDNSAATAILKDHHSANYSKTNVIFNSSLTRDIYKALHIDTGVALVQYFNIAQAIGTNIRFEERRYSLAFIASSFERHIKNIPLAASVFQQLPQYVKIAIGNGSDVFNDIPGTATLKLITQEQILTTLADTRLLIITSYFDSSPSILSEAILNGCNVLVSKNVGWHEMLSDKCVVSDYNDINEWIQKAEYLMNNAVDYTTFRNIMANAEQNIANTIIDVIP